MRSCTNCTILSSRTWNKAGTAKGGQVVEAHSDRWGGQLYILVRDLGDARHFGRFGPHERHILDCRVRRTEPKNKYTVFLARPLEQNLQTCYKENVRPDVAQKDYCKPGGLCGELSFRNRK